MEAPDEALLLYALPFKKEHADHVCLLLRLVDTLALGPVFGKLLIPSYGDAINENIGYRGQLSFLLKWG